MELFNKKKKEEEKMMAEIEAKIEKERIEEPTFSIIAAYYDKYGFDDFTRHLQEPGLTLENLIAGERGKVLLSATRFAVNYLKKQSTITTTN